MIGDIQGCDAALQALLQTLDFSPSRDTLFVLGDLVNRGPSSLATIRRLMALGDSAQCLLGNHDLHLLAVGLTGARVKPQDTLDGILEATDRGPLLHWLRHRPLAIDSHGWLMVHAGVLPQWTRAQTIALAKSAQAMLRSEAHLEFFKNMYGNWPNQWQASSARNPEWTEFDETRLVINALTRIRLCDSHGQLDFTYKGDATQAPPGLMPWYAVPGRQTADTRIAFGHWSTLQAPESGLFEPPMVLPLDTGCVWGGYLTAAEFRAESAQVTLIKQPCPQAQQPG